MELVRQDSILENIRKRKLLLKISAGAGLLAVLSACGNSIESGNNSNSEPSPTATISKDSSPSQTAAPSESASSQIDIKNNEIAELTGISTIPEAFTAIDDFEKVFNYLDPNAVKEGNTAYSEAVQGDPKKYIALYSIDKEEFLVAQEAQVMFLNEIKDITIPADEAEAFAELDSSDFYYEKRVKAIKAYTFLNQYIIEQGTIDLFPKNRKNVACADFGDPKDKLTKYIYASGAGGFLISITKDSVACDDTGTPYDIYKEYLPDFDERFPNFSQYFIALKSAEQQAIVELS